MDQNVNKVPEVLLESEKNDIEEKVLSETLPKSTEDVKFVPPASESDVRSKSKKELVDQFLELQKTQGKTTYSEAVIKKMTKLQIIKLMAIYANEVVGGDPIVTTPNTDDKTRDLLKTAEGLNIIAEGIFNMNLALVSGTESLSVYMKSRTKNIAILEGFTDNVIQRKEAFMAVFKGIYLNYKPEFDKYLSPSVQYLMIMTQIAMITVAENIKKKDESLNPN